MLKEVFFKVSSNLLCLIGLTLHHGNNGFDCIFEDRYNADIQETNNLLQGLPKYIYSLINHYTNAKDIWDNVKMLLEGLKLTKEDCESRLFVTTVKLNRGLRDSNYDQLYAYLKQHEGRQNKGQGNNAQGAGAAGYGGAYNRVGMLIQVKQGRLSATTAMENGVTLDEEQLLFIAGGQDNVVNDDVDEKPIQDLALNVDNVFQADDCDAFNSDVDEAPTTQTMFIANLSSADPVYDEADSYYDSDVLSEVPHHYHYQDDVCEHHEVHEMHDDVQPNYVVDSHTGYTSDSNMIAYDQYVKDNAVQVVQRDVSAVPNDAYMMILNDMHEPPAQQVYVITQTKVVDKSFTVELATYKEQVELHERRARFELTKREQKINEQLRIVITDRNIKEENLKKELHSVKMQLASTINHNKSMETHSDADHTLDFKALDFQITQLTEKVLVLQEQNELFRVENAKVEQHYTELYNSVKITCAKHIDQKIALLIENENLKVQINVKLECVTIDCVTPKVLAPGMYVADVTPIPPRLMNNKEVHLDYLKHLKESVATLRAIVEEAKIERPLDRSVKSAFLYIKHSQELLEYIVHWYLDSGSSKHMTGDRSRLRNFVKKFIWTVRFGNDHFGAIMGYGDYVIGDNVISRVYYVEGLGHNLFSIGKSYDSDLEVAFRKHSCYVHDTDGVELIKGSRGSKLYTISVEYMMKSSPICLLYKASKTKSWLWHHRLNHLNFGKSKKHTHLPIAENTNLEVLNTLHMDLCGPMRVQTINGKKYILVIVDDYTRFTWVKFLRLKDETPKAPMFLWAEAIATACYTQNRSLIHTRHNKTLYELVHNKKPDLTFLRVFGALCYPINDSKDLGKLQPTADIEIFIGYAPSRKGYRIYNKRTRRIMETIHVQFDELSEPMAPVQLSTGPAPTFLTSRQISSGLIPNLVPAAPYVPPTNKYLKILFQPMFDEYLEPPRVGRLVSPSSAVPVPIILTGTPSSTAIDQDAPSPSHSLLSSALQSPCLHQGVAAKSTLMDENLFTPIDNDLLHKHICFGTYF
nr:hypothetical protein [Tanacetum cinerariifolium]